MSAKIDHRVVEMAFENSQFEQGAATSMKTLEKLNKSLQLEGATKGFSDVETKIKGFSLDNIQSSLDVITSKFTLLGRIGLNTFDRIANSAISTGVQMAKALTIEPVSSGLKEYELKMDNIQTIFTNVKRYGSTMNDVAGALDELNLYADKTIYNFQEMTGAIGQFTTQGVQLETAVGAVKGVSNLAAYVGAPAADASRAMYQLAQGLATGYISLQDWMSVEHTAGMAGIEFKERLMEVSRALGTGVDEAIAKTGDFRNSLKEKWLTSDVLTTTLKIFAGEIDEATLAEIGFTEAQIESAIALGRTATEAATVVKTSSQLVDTLKEAAQSGWAETWEILIGDLDEAKELFTIINRLVGGFLDNMSSSRNEMLKTWKELGGRTILLESLSNAFYGLMSILTPVAQAIRDVFPKMNAENLLNLTKKLRDFSENLGISQEAAWGLREIIKFLLQPLKMFANLLGFAIKFVMPIAKEIKEFGEALLFLGGYILYAVKPFERLKNVLSDYGVFDKLNIIGNKLIEMFSILGRKIVDLLSSINITPLLKFFAAVVAFAGNAAFNLLLKGLDYLASLDFTKVGVYFDKITESIKNFFSSLKGVDLFEALRNQIQEWKPGKDFNCPADIIFNLAGLIKKGAGLLGTAFSSVFGLFGGFIEKIKWTCTNLAKWIGEMISSTKRINYVNVFLMAFGTAVAVSLVKIAKAFDSFADFISTIGDVVKNFGESITKGFDTVIKSLKAWKNTLNAKAIMDIAIAIGILAASLIALSFVKGEDLLPAVAALGIMTVVLGGIVAGLAVLRRFRYISNIESLTKSMLVLASGIAILSAALVIMNKLNMSHVWEKVGILITIMTAFGLISALMGKIAPALSKGSLFLVVFSLTISRIMESLVNLSYGNLTGLQPAVDTLIKIMAGLGFMGLLMSRVRFGSAAGIVGILLAIKLMLPLLDEIGKTDFSGIKSKIENNKLLIIEIIGIAYLLALLAGYIAKGMTKIGIGLLLMAAAIPILAKVGTMFGKLSEEEFDRGLGAITVLLLIFTALSAVSYFAGEYATRVGKAILWMSGAALLLTVVAKRFGQLSKKELIKGVGAISVLMLLFGGLMAITSIAQNASKTIIALSAAVGILVTSVALLTLIPDSGKLILSAVSMAIALGGLAAALFAASKIADKKAIGVILSLVGAILVISGALIILSNNPWQNVLVSAGALSAVMLVLAGITKFAKKSLKAAKTMALLSIPLAVVSGALFILADKPWEGILAGAVAISAVMAVLAGITNFVKPAIQGALSMLLLCVPLAAITAALWFLQDIDWQQMLASALALGGVMIALAAAAVIANNASITGSAAMLVLSVALIALSGAFKIMEGIDIESVGIALLGFAGALILLGVASAVFSLVVPGAIALTAALIGLGIAIFLPLAGIALIIAALALLDQEGNLHMDNFKQGISDVVAGAFEGLGRALPSLVAGLIGGIVDAIVGAFKAVVGGLQKVGAWIVREIGNGAESAANGVSQTMGGIGKKLGEAITSKFQDEVEVHSESAWMRWVINEVGNGALSGFGDIIPKVKSAAEELGIETKTGITIPIDEAVEYAKEKLGGLSALGDEFIRNNFDWIKDLVNWDAYGQELPDATDAVNAASEAVAGLGEAAGGKSGRGGSSKKLKEFEDTIVEIPDIMQEATMTMDSFIKKFNEGGKALADPASTEAFLQNTKSTFDFFMEQNYQLWANSEEGIQKIKEEEEEIERLAKEAQEAGVEFDAEAKRAQYRLRDINQAYLDLRNGLIETISGQMDIFSKFEKKTELSSKSLLENMKSQLDGVREWANMLQNLAARGIEQGLLKKLSEMGPQSYEYVNAFVKMTDEQLTEANTMYTESLAVPTQATDKILSGYMYAGLQAAAGFQEGITDGTAEATDSAISMGIDALEGLEGALEIHSPSRKTMQDGINFVDGFRLGAKQEEPFAIRTVTEIADSIYNTFKKKLADEKFVKIGRGIIIALRRGLLANRSTLTDAIKEICGGIIADFKENLSEDVFSEIGENVSAGMAKGVSGATGKVGEAAGEVAEGAVEKLKEVTEENSPSKIAEEIGMYLTEGFAIGIGENASKVDRSAENVGNSAIDSLRNTLSSLYKVLDSDMDFEPVITPVLDLSDIESGANRMNNLFSNGINVEAPYEGVRATAAKINAKVKEMEILKSGENSKSGDSNVSFVQNNYSPKALNRLEIYRQTKNLFALRRGMG